DRPQSRLALRGEQALVGGELGAGELEELVVDPLGHPHVTADRRADVPLVERHERFREQAHFPPRGTLCTTTPASSSAVLRRCVNAQASASRRTSAWWCSKPRSASRRTRARMPTSKLRPPFEMPATLTIMVSSNVAFFARFI